MPLEETEKFIATLQKGNRLQVPVLVRWKNRLDPRELLSVYIWNPGLYKSQAFYAKMSRDGRFTVPKLIGEVLQAQPGDVLEVTLHARKAKR